MGMPFQPWREAMLPPSFRGVPFYVEAGGQAGGRRGPVHEYPKRDEPSAEDLGRKARRWVVTAYVIGPNYIAERDALIAACEAGGPGTLVHPTLGIKTVNCPDYSTHEDRVRGGVCTFEMLFVESGSFAGGGVSADTQSQANTAASNLGTSSAQSLDSATSASTDSGGTISA